MVPVMTWFMASVPGSEFPRNLSFWFVMSIALFAGGIIAYPMNWWLVARHLKHGMMTVRRREVEHREAAAEGEMGEMSHPAMTSGHVGKPSRAGVVWMAALSVVLFAVGIVLSVIAP